MLDLSPFDTLLYWYPSFVSALPKSDNEQASIPLKLQAVYEVTYDLVQNETCTRVYWYVENAVHQYLNNLQVLLDASDKRTYPYILQEKASKPMEQLLLKLNVQMGEEVEPSQDRKICLEILQTFLVWCYAEVCEKRLELLKEDEVPLFQIYQGYFQSEEPNPPCIHERITTLETQPINSPKLLTQTKPVKPKTTFEQLIQIPDQFQRAEQLMMENKLIDENRKAIVNHGNRKYLAAVYVQLIKQGYFHKRIFPENIPIRPIDIRKFLDNRYTVKLPKQFNYWLKNDKEHTTYIEKYFWLENLQACHSN